MRRLRVLAVGALLVWPAMQAVHGQTRTGYRGFELGGSVSSIAALSDVPVSNARTLHLAPALLQELSWRAPSFLSGSTMPQTDPVQRILFSFYDDQLFQMVVDYDFQRTEGMTDADMIAALSAVYGAGSRAATNGTMSALDQEFGTPLARWRDLDRLLVLYRSSYATAFRLTVTSPRLAALARTATAQAFLRQERDAPILERARQKQEADEAREAQEKARAANLAAFTP